MSLAPALGAVLLGAAARARGFVSRDDGRAICRALFATTLPAVMARTFASVTTDGASGGVLIAGALYGLACVALAASTRARTRSGGGGGAAARARAALVSGSALGVNLGNFAYGLSETLYGVEGLRRAVVFDATNQVWLLVVAHAVYAHRTEMDVGGDRETRRAATRRRVAASLAKQARNPCLVAVVVAFAYRVMVGHANGFPPAIDGFLEFLGGANKTFAMLALGILFEPKIASADLCALGSALARRYGTSMMCAGVTLACVGPMLGELGSAVTVTCMLSPIALLTVAYAMEFSLDVTFAAALVNYSNLISLVMIFAISRVSFADPVALAPALLACGAATFGAGALLDRVEDRAERARGDCVVTTALDRSMRVSAPVVARRRRVAGVHVVSRSSRLASRVHVVANRAPRRAQRGAVTSLHRCASSSRVLAASFRIA